MFKTYYNEESKKFDWENFHLDVKMVLSDIERIEETSRNTRSNDGHTIIAQAIDGVYYAGTRWLDITPSGKLIKTTYVVSAKLGIPHSIGFKFYDDLCGRRDPRPW